MARTREVAEGVAGLAERAGRDYLINGGLFFAVLELIGCAVAARGAMLALIAVGVAGIAVNIWLLVKRPPRAWQWAAGGVVFVAEVAALIVLAA